MARKVNRWYHLLGSVYFLADFDLICSLPRVPLPTARADHAICQIMLLIVFINLTPLEMPTVKSGPLRYYHYLIRWRSLRIRPPGVVPDTVHMSYEESSGAAREIEGRFPRDDRKEREHTPRQEKKQLRGLFFFCVMFYPAILIQLHLGSRGGCIFRFKKDFARLNTKRKLSVF